MKMTLSFPAEDIGKTVSDYESPNTFFLFNIALSFIQDVSWQHIEYDTLIEMISTGKVTFRKNLFPLHNFLIGTLVVIFELNELGPQILKSVVGLTRALNATLILNSIFVIDYLFGQV